MVAGTYRPLSAASHTVDDLAELLNPYIKPEMLILGDLNLNWLNNAANHLKEVCGNLSLAKLTTEPTQPNLH